MDGGGPLPDCLQDPPLFNDEVTEGRGSNAVILAEIWFKSDAFIDSLVFIGLHCSQFASSSTSSVSDWREASGYCRYGVLEYVLPGL